TASFAAIGGTWLASRLAILLHYPWIQVFYLAHDVAEGWRSQELAHLILDGCNRFLLEIRGILLILIYPERPHQGIPELRDNSSPKRFIAKHAGDGQERTCLYF